MWFALGIVGFTVAAAFDYRWLRTFSWLIYLFTLGMLVATLVIGVTINGAQRWISIAGLQFQFSELAKVLMIAVLAAFLAARKDKLTSLWTIVGATLSDDSGVPARPRPARPGHEPRLPGDPRRDALHERGQPEVDDARPGRRSRCDAGDLVAAAGLPTPPRPLSLDPTSDQTGAGWQALQSQIAVGSGGFFGKGLTNGSQSGSSFLPVQSTDFAFAVLLEELGFVGGIVVLLLFIGLIWRILLIGWRSESVFGVAFASGVASMIVFQILVNAGMVAGMMPVTAFRCRSSPTVARH